MASKLLHFLMTVATDRDVAKQFRANKKQTALAHGLDEATADMVHAENVAAIKAKIQQDDNVELQLEPGPIVTTLNLRSQ